ncbi:hypothetical protein DENSPDRAFT_853791 [Dentipellis sp. KUC8613]|nr:hypothetical protein DENSPDRAFT_853791 [Dentipellis sp. KUC8613]
MSVFCRSDRARFIGCRVGGVAILTCDKGCCADWGSSPAEIEKYERYQYLNPLFDNRRYRDLDENGQSCWRPPSCINPHRPKYVCLGCRRTYKPAYIQGNDYEMSRARDQWFVRPSDDRIREITSTLKKQKKNEVEQEKARQCEDWLRSSTYGHILSKHDIRQLKYTWKYEWQVPLESRCPGCGTAGLAIGNSFRPPKRNDEKAWLEVKGLIEAGELFSFCMTRNEEREVKKEAERVATREAQKEVWAAEKRRRLKALGLIKDKSSSTEGH